MSSNLTGIFNLKFHSITKGLELCCEKRVSAEVYIKILNKLIIESNRNRYALKDFCDRIITNVKIVKGRTDVLRFVYIDGKKRIQKIKKLRYAYAFNEIDEWDIINSNTELELKYKRMGLSIQGGKFSELE